MTTKTEAKKMNALTDAAGNVVGEIAHTVVAKPDKASQMIVGLFFMVMVAGQALSLYRDGVQSDRTLILEIQIETYLRLKNEERQRDHERNQREVEWKRRISDKVDAVLLAVAPNARKDE